MPTIKFLLSKLEVSSYDRSTYEKTNLDIKPLPPERRTYGPWNFVALWVVTGSFNIGGWTTGSSLIALGLNVWQCMLTVIVGNIIVGFLCVLSGHPGAKHHIGFPVIQRSSWGVRGYVFVVVQRVFLACIWFSTQVYWGGQCMRTLLTAIAPRFRRLNRPLANGTMTTGDFTGFILFTLCYLPLIAVRPERYHIPFLVSCLCIIPTVFVLLIYFVVKAQGAGDLVDDVSAVAGVAQATGSRLGWMLVLGICTNISSISVHIYVQSDYTRYARRPKDQILAQLVMVPLGTIVVALIGILCASCAVKLFPEKHGVLLWEPYRLLDALQVHHDNSSGSRAAVFFASLAFMVAQFGMVVANNGLSAGMDLSALLPRFFTIRRGIKFLMVLGGYGVFLGPMTGVYFSDYFIVRRTSFEIQDLYNETASSIYWYQKGCNWRALVAWVAGVWITLPGFIRWVQGGSTLVGWSHLYYFSWPLGMTISLMTYWILNKLSPVLGTIYAEPAEMNTSEVIEGQEPSEIARSDISFPAKA
ncbi:putative permease C29B12.14c [Pseudocercospora fuligena]|uniref:Putative permease C29B12.14c n=1 Tax=Pseudocercospora fuligena TaxID=685502 RepID=A0A8H6RHH0_9PEZI|nr:putative permease C29B12.14c [Pseudocercospora fuligena]